MKALLSDMALALEGRASVEEIASRIGVDASRLGIYARFCAAHRRDALVHVFSRTADALGARLAPLIEQYFLAFPMHSVELNENGDHFAEFLSAEGWIAELADFEWWEWRTLTQRVNAPAPGLHIAPTVELRSYSRNFCEDEMPQERTLVIFWRDADEHLRREPATAAELQILQTIHAGGTPEHSETLSDLLAAAILRRC